MSEFRKKYAFYDIDEEGKYIGDYEGFEPSYPPILRDQHTFNRLVNRPARPPSQESHNNWPKENVGGNYEIKRYPNNPMENSIVSVVRDFFKRMGRRV